MVPDQPLVLNYLGYSWIDQGKNLKQGMGLIEKAVALKPDDGYIVDSLGWAHFRQGNYKEAVRYLERAVELKPDDPVLNDHLGDALWRVGREREARFQWDQALSLKPEPEDLEKIKKKLESGLEAAGPGRAGEEEQQGSRRARQSDAGAVESEFGQERIGRDQHSRTSHSQLVLATLSKPRHAAHQRTRPSKNQSDAARAGQASGRVSSDREPRRHSRTVGDDVRLDR